MKQHVKIEFDSDKIEDGANSEVYITGLRNKLLMLDALNQATQNILESAIPEYEFIEKLVVSSNKENSNESLEILKKNINRSED